MNAYIYFNQFNITSLTLHGTSEANNIVLKYSLTLE